MRLAWEFLRRNRDYAKNFEAISKLKPGEFENGIGVDSDSCLDATECVPPSLKGETRAQYKKRMRDAGTVGRVAKHKHVFQSKWSLLEPVDPNNEYNEELVKFTLHEVKVKKPTGNQRQSFRLSLANNEIMMRFRLDMNVVPQLVSALTRWNESASQYDQLSGQASKLRKMRADSVNRMAHVWLRCYDAYQLPEKFVDDPVRKRKLKSGPTAIQKCFLNEAKIQKLNATDPRTKTNDKNPPSWYKRAADFIEEKHYLKLLYPQTSINDNRALQSLMSTWLSK